MSRVYSWQGWRVVTAALLAVLLMSTYLVSQANANHQPADKPFAAASKIDRFDVGTATTLLTATVRNSKPADIMLLVSMECSIITDVTTTGDDKSNARGQLRYYLTLSTNGGPEKPVGVMQTATSTTSPGTTTDDGNVVFCDRIYERETSLFGEDDQDHTIRTFIETRHANAFNWVQLNAGNGVHTLKLYATYTEAKLNTADAEGVVGRRTMIIEPVKAKNDEQVTDLVVD